MNNIVPNIEEDDSIDLKRIFSKLIERWHWFLISIIITLGSAFLYNNLTAPTYQINAKLLVNDDEKGGGLGKQAGALMDLGSVLGSKSSVDNETEVLKTRFLMEQVVRDMQLNIVYSWKNNFVRRELERSPIKLVLLKEVDTIKNTRLDVEKISNERLHVTAKNFSKDVRFGESFQIKNVGTLEILKNFEVPFHNADYSITVSSVDQRVAALMKQLTVAVTNKQVTIIDMGLLYPLQAQGELVLNTLINKYVSTNLTDKNAIADSTYKFIRERINIIASELGDVENKVEDFKQTNKLSDMSEQGKLLVQNTGQFTVELAKAETAVAVLNDLEAYLKDEQKNKRVFPTSLLPSDMIFSELLNQYNTLLVERDRQLLSVTETSPFIKNIDEQIQNLRSGIISNIANTKNSFIQNRDKLRSQLRKAESQIGGVPQIEKNYLKLARNQQIKQELYIFLMQKAEETAISKTSNISVAKTIDPPKADATPVSPKTNVIYIMALIFGVILPIATIFIWDYIDDTISSKEDIEKQTMVPIIGEISHNQFQDNLIVANQGRSAISEQFRALRTSLSFYLKATDDKVILLTSSMSGEGKSFTAINLGNIFALTGKKVLLMELDLRKPGLSAKLNITSATGFSRYAIDPNVTASEIIQPLSINPNMFIVPSGPLPPNPAELLMSDRTAELFTELKKQFDYIIVDAPPVGLIIDAQLLSPYSNAVLYLVRQKVSQKGQMKIVEELYKSGKMKNLGIVVNDISGKYFGYGYEYGDYGQVQKTGFMSDLFKKFKRG